MQHVVLLKECLTFQLNWTEFLPKVDSEDWSGPIIIRMPEYIKKLSELLSTTTNRVVHNSLLLLFVVDVLPEEDPPTSLMCTRAVVSSQLIK